MKKSSYPIKRSKLRNNLSQQSRYRTILQYHPNPVLNVTAPRDNPTTLACLRRSPSSWWLPRTVSPDRRPASSSSSTSSSSSPSSSSSHHQHDSNHRHHHHHHHHHGGLLGAGAPCSCTAVGVYKQGSSCSCSIGGAEREQEW